MKIALTLQYNGSLFFGFQAQNDQRTVQSELESALRVYFQRDIRVHCAGRTDAGVHAAGQVVHFEISEDVYNAKDKPLDQIIYHMNCILPRDVSITYGSIVNDEFHARFSCIGREYVYPLLNSRYRMALYEKDQLWIQYPLDVQLMQEAANMLIGEHDFAAFTKAFYKKTNERTIRRIDEIKIIPRNHTVYLYYNGSGFLHNMIRIISGTLIMAGKKSISPDTVHDILLSQDRRHVGKTLPAFPLVFLNARYQDYATPKDLIPYYFLLGLDL